MQSVGTFSKGECDAVHVATEHANGPRGAEPVLLRLLARAAGMAPAVGPFRRSEQVEFVRSVTGSTVPTGELERALNQVRVVTKYVTNRLLSVDAGRASTWFEYCLSDDLLMARQQREAIMFVFWHVGILPGIFPALSAIAPDVRMIKSGKVFRKESSGLGVLETAEDDDARSIGNAKLLKAAVSHLKRGGAIGTFIDGTNGQSAAEVSFFGRPIYVRRGTALLNRLSGAAVFPCVCRWDSDLGRLRFVIGERIRGVSAGGTRTPEEVEVQEREFLQRCVNWFEQHLRKHPEDLTRAATHIVDQAGVMANERAPGAAGSRVSARCA